MTLLRILLMSLLPALAFAQADQDRKVNIPLEADRHIELIYRGDRLVYVGEHYLRDLSLYGPVGLHHVFNLDGSLQRSLDYSVSKDLWFEGKPHLVRTTTVYDRQGRVARRLQAHRCTDCDYAPMGVWQWYRQGKLVRSVDVSQVTDVEQASRYERDANDETYWPSSRPKPQQEIPKRRARP